MALCIYKMLDRRLEKTSLNGYLIYIKYNGIEYDSFDENKNCRSVKSELKKILFNENIPIYKGLQQAGRTDAMVNANENIIYLVTKANDISKLLKYEYILKIEKVIPFLELPNFIEKRKYIFEYPIDKILNDEEKIKNLCINLSGTKDYKKFTTKKGRLLKNTIRTINISYKDNKLEFIGDSFLPHQVRIMSSYILTNSLKELDGKYLTLDKIYIKKELKDLILKKIEFEHENIVYCEKSEKYTFIYTKDKSKLIGKNGKNIKKLGFSNKVIIREV